MRRTGEVNDRRAESVRRSLVAAALAFCAVLLGNAQDRPRPAVDLGAAWIGFADDGVVSEGAIDGAVRWYASPRIAIGPELLYIRGDNHGWRWGSLPSQ